MNKRQITYYFGFIISFILFTPNGIFAVDLDGTNGNDNLVGTNDEDTIEGKDGDDKIKGLNAHDVLRGGGDDDKIKGGDGVTS